MHASRRSDSSTPLLIWGDNEFQVKLRARQVYRQWCDEIGGDDHEIINATATNATEALRVLGRLREALDTLPFFGNGKAIWFRDCNLLAEERAASSQAISKLLSDTATYLKGFPWGSTRLLITATHVDRRRLFYKAIDQTGSVEHHPELSLDDRDWMDRASAQVNQQLSERGKEASHDVLLLLVTSVGPNSRQLHNETEKVSLYVGDRPQITAADVRAVVSRNKQARAFALADALGERDASLLMQTLDEELSQLSTDRQKSEIGILYGLISKVRTMLLARALMSEGRIKAESQYARFKSQLSRLSPDDLPTDRRFNPLAMHPYMFYRATLQAERYTEPELLRAMELLLRCNRELLFSSLDSGLVLQRTLTEIVGTGK